MDFFSKSNRDYKNLRSNAVNRANGGNSGGMTGGDWAGIGLQILGAISQQKAAEDEQRRLDEANRSAMEMNKQRYADSRGDIQDQKIKQDQDTRYRGLNFINDQVDSNRAMSRKRSFRDAMYDYMRV